MADMDFDQLRHFVCIAQLGGFSKAEKALDISQPSLSRQMRLLEADLNAKLFLRTGRGVTLTPAGEAFLPHAITVLESVARGRQALGSASTDLTGRVSVGLVPRIARVLLAPLVQRFRARLPNATISVVESKTPVLLSSLAAGHVDVAVLFNIEAPEDLIIEPLAQEHYVLIGLRTPDLALPESLPFDALARYPLILPPPSNSIRANLELVRRRTRTRFDVVAEVETMPALFDLIRLGVGLSVVGHGAARQLAHSREFTSARIEGITSRNVAYLARSRRADPTHLGDAVAQMIRDLDLADLLGADAVSSAEPDAQV